MTIMQAAEFALYKLYKKLDTKEPHAESIVKLIEQIGGTIKCSGEIFIRLGKHLVK